MSITACECRDTSRGPGLWLAAEGGHEATVAAAEAPLAVELFGDFVVGEVAVERGVLWERMRREAEQAEDRAAAAAALCAMDVALWHLAAASTGVGLRALLGGHWRERVDVCLTGLEAGPSRRATADGAAGLAAAGARALEVTLEGEAYEEHTKALKAVREAVGPAVRLVARHASSYPTGDLPAAAEALEKRDLYWFSQQWPREAEEAAVELGRHSALPLAGGEGGGGAKAVLAWLRQEAWDLLLISLEQWGGPTGARAVADMAHQLGVRVSFRVTQPGAVGLAGHLTCACPNAGLLLAPADVTDLQDGFLAAESLVGGPGAGGEPTGQDETGVGF